VALAGFREDEQIHRPDEDGEKNQHDDEQRVTESLRAE